jgi:hypothetical protein
MLWPNTKRSRPTDPDMSHLFVTQARQPVPGAARFRHVFPERPRKMWSAN